jgi:hypothetical protein
MRKLFEAVSVTEALPEIKEIVYVIAEREWKSAPTNITAWWDGKRWCSSQENEDEQIIVTAWLRPVEPQGVPKNNEIRDWASRSTPSDGDVENEASEVVGKQEGAKWMRSKLAPLLADKDAEIERLRKALEEVIRMGNAGKSLPHIDSHVSEFARKVLTT